MIFRSFFAIWTSATGFAASAATIAVEVRDAAGTALSDAAVFATARSGATSSRLRREVEIEQSKRQFQPFVTVIQKDTPVRFPNRDDVRHHVYSFSPSKQFEIKLYVGTPAEPIVFDRTGEVVLACNIHDHMRAYVFVVDTPYFAKTDASGSAVLEGLPANEYLVAVWHFSQTGATAGQRMRVRGDENAALRFQLATRRPPQKK